GVGPVCVAPPRVMRVNTLSTLYVFEWFVQTAAPGARLLYASSSEVYGGASGLNLPIPTPESVPAVISDPQNPRYSYAVSKLWGEMYARFLAKSTGALLATVRYHNVYGPRMGYDHVIPQVVTRVATREKPFRVIGAEE